MWPVVSDTECLVIILGHLLENKFRCSFRSVVLNTLGHVYVVIVCLHADSLCHVKTQSRYILKNTRDPIEGFPPYYRQ